MYCTVCEGYRKVDTLQGVAFATCTKCVSRGRVEQALAHIPDTFGGCISSAGV